MTRTFPYYGWLGAVIVLVPEAGIFARIQPFVVWHTPIARGGLHPPDQCAGPQRFPPLAVDCFTMYVSIRFAPCTAGESVLIRVGGE
jgi:hypothetical protein